VLHKVGEEMVEKYFFRQLQETQKDTGRSAVVHSVHVSHW